MSKQLREKFEGLLDSVGNGIQDLTTLTVVTYTGDIQVDFAGGKLDLEALEPKATDLHVAAMTQISLDTDISQVRSGDEQPEELIALHETAVKTAIEARAAVVKMLADVVTSL